MIKHADSSWERERVVCVCYSVRSTYCTSLWNVIDILRHNTTLFPRVDIKFDAAADSALSPILLHINPHLDLLFTAHHQRLRTISLRRLADPNPPITLTYKDVVLLSASSTRPTYPGEGLQYPGVSFLFDEDGTSGLGLSGAEALKSASNVGSSVREDRYREVKRVVVSQTSLDGAETDALDEVSECDTMEGSIQNAVLKVHDGVILYFYPTASRPIHIRIGVTSAQDLTCDLGAPLRVYYKEDERMAIHSHNRVPDGIEDGYFYNYFQLGVDFLISASNHLVQKVVVHTNIPGTPMFQRYQRCPWEIQGEPEDEEDGNRLEYIFDVISRFLNGPSREQMPSMQLDRTEDERLILPSSTTRLVGFDGIVLEVTEAAQVVTVVLF
ncbi:hypothetical protein EW145_g472 [Phellinidium pouzarii]|uniref:Uncharacterized protein n=1 Tax=Phellinidium pouzarii TaxID=167371 RepID=A0A4S4LI58_9AGAM|nr:hypothetical protein EW145_g472 [Phellinidium pouzarii]